MPIDPANRSQPPTANTQQSAETSKAGSYNNRTVRRPTESENRGLFSTLRSYFGGRSRRARGEVSSPVQSNRSVRQASVNLAGGQVGILIDAAKSGIAAAKQNIVEGLASEKSSAEVKSFFESGDKGVRRGTTAAYNLGEKVNFADLSPQQKAQLPSHSLDTIAQQATQIKELAQAVSSATFLSGTRDFSQFGTTKNNGYTEVIAKYPERETEARAWIRDGLNIASDLINAQEQLLFQGETLSDDQLSALQSRVNDFTRTEENAFKPVDSKSEMEGFSDEVMKEVDKPKKMETEV